jgi:lauroyl/myristoyl acyltransferase
MKHQIIDFSIKLFIKTLTCFSRKTRFKFASFIAPLILKISKRTRLRAIANVTNAMPQLTSAQVNDVVIASYKTIVFGVLECFWLDEIEIDIECDENTLMLLNNTKGVSVATMHMSCYELAPFSIQKLVGSATTLSKIPTFIKSAANIYKNANIKVIDKNKPNAFLSLLQASRKNEVICLHADHYATDVDVCFFNQQTKAPSGTAMISAYNKVPLLLCYPVLNDNGRYTVFFETVVDTYVENNPQAIACAVQQIYHKFEAIITQHPNQWYWSYNRWRK